MATAADKQEMEADIVVIGYSGAGATEARPVHDNDATVIVLRKCPPGFVHYSSTGNLASDRLNDWAGCL